MLFCLRAILIRACSEIGWPGSALQLRTANDMSDIAMSMDERGVDV